MKKLFFFFAVCFLTMMTAASIKVSAQPSTDINTYVLFGLDRLSFKGGSQSSGWGIVYGNIGVNNAAAAAKTVSLEFATSGFAYMADGYQAVGDHVRGDAGGSFYDLYANKLIGNFGAVIRNLGPVAFTPPIIAPGSLPVFPFVPNRVLTNGPSDVPPGIAIDLTINTGAIVTLAPGAYRNVKIKDDAVVTFGAGIYDMRDVSIGKAVTFIVDNNTIFQVDRTFRPNNNFLFGALGTEDAKIYVGAYGLDWTTTTATNFSHYGEIHATYYAPTGWLDIGGKNKLFGHFWARSVSGDANDNVYIPPPPTFPCPDGPCVPPFSSIYSTNINDYVLFAYNELIFKGGNLANGMGYIFGNIGVNYSVADANPHSNFSLDFATSKSAWIADGYQAVADAVRGDASGSFYDLFANMLNPSFASDIRHSGPIPWTPPIIPTLSLPSLGFIPGPGRGTDVAPDLTIPNGATATFAPPFTYHNVRINDDAVVTFGPGTYDMWNLSVGKDVTFIVDDATILQIDVKFDPNDRLHFGIGSHAGAKIYVGHYGLPSTELASNFSHGAEIHANYFSPTGDLDIGGGNLLYGHFWALRITGDPNNTVFCDSPSCTGDSPMTSVNPSVKGAGMQITIFPNPAKESFTLLINNSISQGSIVTLSDLAGKEILHTSLQLQEGVNNYPVSIAGITPGVYIVKLQTNTGVVQTKLIISK